MSDAHQTTIMIDLNTNISRTVNSTASHIDLYFRGKALTFGKHQLPVNMGRDGSACQIVVSREVVSRIHCRIEVQDNLIGITDCSQNGTFLHIGSNPSFILKGRFYPLIGQGKIRLGEPFGGDDAESLLFRMSNRGS
jgi:hypothetical protein